MPMTPACKPRRREARLLLASQDGFTMLVALGVMLVASLLMVAAFEAAQGDIGLSHKDTLQKQAYYAALAGVEEYEYHLQANPDYWESCAAPSNQVPNEPASAMKSSCSRRAPPQKEPKPAARGARLRA